MSLDLSLLKRLAKDEVMRHIETGHQEKDLIIESTLMKPLERIIGFSQLKERGVTKIYKLEPVISSLSSNIIYIISTDNNAVKSVINHIRIDHMNNTTRKRWVLFYPGKSVVADYLLETEGVIGDVIIEELALNFLPLDSDVLSMEYPLAFKQLFIDRTHIPLYSVARALLNLQSLYGEISSVYTIGHYSYKLVEMWKKTMHGSLPSTSNVPPEIGTLIIIDRNVDPITVCSSQLTFEGLISEVFSIKSGFIELGKSKYLLTDIEPIYNEIRNYPLTKVVPVIKDNIKELQERQAKGKQITSVSDIKKFVSNELKKIQMQQKNLIMYLNCAEEIITQKKKEHFERRIDIEDYLRRSENFDEIIKYIEWSIITQKDMLSCLKLLCLWNCTKINNINKYKKHFIDIFVKSYGFNHLSTFFNLERSEFFTDYNASQKLNYRNIGEEFDLIPNDSESIVTDDISDVFNQKYRPFSSTLIEKIISKNFPKVDCSKFFSHGIQSYFFSDPDKISDDAKNVYAVFYLGGICHSEISCLRILSKKYNKTIIVLTTSIVNGSDIMSMHVDQL